MFVEGTKLVNGVSINYRLEGSGYPLLLLHGYPQTQQMWHKIAPSLAADFTVVTADLRGYGDSAKPPALPDYRNYSKRVMATDMVQLMEVLGYEQFALIGHDRGGRVAHRLTLDYPQRVSKLGILDIVPTYDMYYTTDREFARTYFHWFFLIQPYPFPETLIAANPDYFLEYCLRSWSQDFNAFTPEALEEYRRCFRQGETIHGTCSDYRAAATVDLEDDQSDRTTKITCPVLVLWGKKGLMARKYDVLELWRQRAADVRGQALSCGHFLPEEAPEETLEQIRLFLREGDGFTPC
jgi:haloacetate dehalogenase